MKLYRLKDQAFINMGQSPKSEFYNYNKIGTPFLQGKTSFGDKYHSIDMWTSSPIKIARKGDILLSVRAPVGSLNIAIEDVCIGRGLASLTSKYGNNEYLYYLLKANSDKLANKSSGTIFESVNKNDIENLQISFHNVVEQEKIANILSSLDDKIELNNKINKNLEELAQTLYKRWFVDFEFPNKDGEPYKSSGGEMVESELGLIPKGWFVKEQGEYFPVITGKKNANIATSDGNYKFFTCSQEVYLTDNYSFEGDAILVAGNGDFNVKYYSGKFEAYQRTYVLIPHNKKLSGILYFAIQHNLNDITSGSRGSVISFITKGHIENFKVVFPNTITLEKLGNIFKNILISIANNKEENDRLSKLRDELLPKLMNGEIEVPIEE